MLLSLREAGEAIPMQVRIRMEIASPASRNDREGIGQPPAFPTFT
jgi:hypothetical protein